MMDKNKTVDSFVQEWKDDFIERIKTSSGSRKQNFHFGDALKRSNKSNTTKLDNILIKYFSFLKTDPLSKNDYFKFVDSYERGKKLNIKYFRHDIEKLNEYYQKVDNERDEATKENRKPKSRFNRKNWERYVLFMMLKFSDAYLPEYDVMFHVDKENKFREYNPLTNLPSVLRSILPMEVMEFDIEQANPSFIFKELKIEPFDVYDNLMKAKGISRSKAKGDFNMQINLHKGNKNANIDRIRKELFPIYGDRVNEVITDERFNEKGQMQMDMAKHEKEAIKTFVKANNLKYYVRLHDGLFVPYGTECKTLDFGIIKFKIKEITDPKIEKDVINFYDDDKTTSPVSYARFLEQEGFIRITRESHDQITILKNENRIVTPYNHKTDLVPFLRANINEYDTSYLEDRIARESTNAIIQSLQLLEPIPLSYHRDTKTTVDIPFKNGIARITADSIDLISYDKIDGFFPKHSTQKHEINLIDIDAVPCDFRDFLGMACTGIDRGLTLNDQQKETFKAFVSMFGYLISNYKDPSESPAIILSDDGADDESRNGGRGKSIVQRALSFFRPAIEKGGNAYDPNYTHVHADLKLEHDLYLLDDVPSNFDYNALYTHITGSIDAQRKGITAETIPFEYAPKFVISTNWAVRYDKDATSTNRRFLEYKFSNFWNIKNTPKDYFKESLFNDWDADAWNSFYNFGFYCVQCYLKDGLQRIEYDKREDNFRAYFHNDSILQEVQRILEILDGQDFTVTDFIRIHKENQILTYRPEFNIRNAKKYIDAFIDFKNLPYRYEQMNRKWKTYL